MRGLRTVAASAAALTLIGLGSPAYAADGAITHVEVAEDGLQILVDVPADAQVDFSGVEVTIDGEDAESTAESAGTSTGVRRTTILAIDTSDSMVGPRFAAAKSAANVFLNSVPDDVYVGIVDFNAEVGSALPPTLDRADARGVIASLDLSKGTRLYDGVIEAIAEAGNDGQRSILLLSDGADTSETPLESVTSAIKDAGVLVDVVQLDAAGDAAALNELSAAGSGRVINAASADLSAAFAQEAAILSRQVLIKAEVPDGVDKESATIAVTLPTTSGDITDEAFAPIQGAGAVGSGSGLPVAAAEEPGWAAPTWLMPAGIFAFGLGLLGALFLLVPAAARPMTASERLVTYTSSGKFGAGPADQPPEADALASAKEAMAGMLERNQGLNERVGAKLEAAGSDLKASEWLLVHLGIFVGSALIGLVIGGGSLIAGIIFMVLGLVLPWVYLGFKAGRRRKAFNGALPDTLQLISGSLAAGLSLPQSIDTIVREGREPVSSEFKRVLVETRLGVPLEDALDGVAERFDSKDFAWVVMAIKIQRQVGGNLAELLDTVAATMREREYLRRQVAALAAEGKLSAIVLSVLPPGFLLYLLLANREYVMPMFTDPRGLIMLVGATAWLGVGIFWMSKLVKVEV